jgi:hypothetical protein
VLRAAPKKIGFYGFGAAAHILTQVAHWQEERELLSVANLTRKDGIEFPVSLSQYSGFDFSDRIGDAILIRHGHA